MSLFGLFLRVLVPVEVQEFGFLLENKNAVEHITQEADRDGRDGTSQIVVDPPFLQKPDTDAVANPAHHIDHDELKQQPLAFVVENQLAVSRKIEQDANDIAKQRGEDVWVGDVGKVDQPKEPGIDAPAERCVQDGNQHKTDELRVNIPV